MPDITMTQIAGTTHHFRASIDVDPANLEPTVDLFNFIDADANPGIVVEAIQTDQHLEDTIEGEFQAKSTSVTDCKFKPDSLVKIVSPSGHIIGITIQLEIVTTAAVIEEDAIEMKFEFLHSLPR